MTDTAITFEYDVPDKEEFKRRFERISNKYPYIVAEQNKRIIGYAYAGEFIGRKAYDWSAELTVYIEQELSISWEQEENYMIRLKIYCIKWVSLTFMPV